MRAEAKPRRNDPCPCGSGRKFKRCCQAGRTTLASPEPPVPIAPNGHPEEPAPAAPATPGDPFVLPFTLALAFCSIVYELLLGQALAAFLGNTVYRFSVTIGLYMLSMGIGALLARARVLARPVVSLQQVELLLTLLGGSAVMLLFGLDAAGLPSLPFAVVAHLLIVCIGVLTGLEIPLLIELRRGRDPQATSGVLGIDYVGAFLGTVVFAFVLFPHAGLVATSFLTAALNGAVGTLLFLFRRRVDPAARRRHTALVAAQGALLLLLLAGLAFASVITEFSIGLYLES